MLEKLDLCSGCNRYDSLAQGIPSHLDDSSKKAHRDETIPKGLIINVGVMGNAAVDILAKDGANNDAPIVDSVLRPRVRHPKADCHHTKC